MNLFRAIANFFTRGLDASAGWPRWIGAKTIPNWNSAINAAATTARLRSRFQVANNAYLARAVNSIVSNLIGTGIKPQSQHKDEGVRTLLHQLWSIWTDHADPAGRVDFYGLQTLVGRALVTDGESFVWMRTGGARGFNLQLLSADQVDASIHREIGGGARIVAGIEFDASGQRVAYHVFTNPPGEGWPVSLTPMRVPATDMIHVFEGIGSGQVRGLTWFAPILLRLNEIDKLQDAILLKQQMSAMIAAFITDPNGASAELFQANGGSIAQQYKEWDFGQILRTQLSSGTIFALHPGEDVKFTDPAQAGDAIDYLKSELRAVAVGIGITYEQLTGDLSGVNYSSIRAGLVDFRRRIEVLQHQVIAFQFCRPVWRRFITIEILTGRLQGKVEDYLPVEWIPAGFDWVDPSKDVEAETAAIEAGLMSRRQAVAARGYDVEALDAEIAGDKLREKLHGLTFNAKPTTTLKAEVSNNG